IVVMAVNRYVYTTIYKDASNGLTLEDFNMHHLKCNYYGHKVKIYIRDKRKIYVENAMTTAYTYLRENGIPVSPFQLAVRSELDDASGVKYGLGSSAAVVTSVISAMLRMFLPEKPSHTLIFKLASITHVQTQGNGSGADIAASTFGGILAYTSFQAEWLKEAMNVSNSLTEMVDKDWVYWSVEPVQLPENVHMCIGWTGTPASTSQLVKQVLALKQSNPAKF